MKISDLTKNYFFNSIQLKMFKISTVSGPQEVIKIDKKISTQFSLK